MSIPHFLAICLGIVVLSLLVVFALPRWLLASVPAPERPRRQDKLQSLLVTLIGGLGLLLTFAWNMGKDRDEADRANRQESDRQFIEATKLLSRTDAEKSSAVRVAAAFALGNLAKTTPEYRPQVRDVLTAVIFDQLHTAAGAMRGMSPDANLGVDYVSSDVNAALKVLAESSFEPQKGFASVTLNHAILVGSRMARFRGLKMASFEGARLNAADFRCANLSGADFTAAELSDYHAFMSGHPGADGKLDPYQDADRALDMNQWEHSRKFNFIANFEGARLAGADFRGAFLWGASFLRSADLQGARFDDVDISRVDFREAVNLDKAVFTGACASDAPALDPIAGLSREHRNARHEIDYLTIGQAHIPPCAGRTIIKDRQFKPARDTMSLSRDWQWCTADGT